MVLVNIDHPMNTTNSRPKYYLEVLPSELVWHILNNLPSRALKNLRSALPSLESYVIRREDVCSHGYVIKPFPHANCDPVLEWTRWHRRNRVIINLDKGILCNRNVYDLTSTQDLAISTDGSLISSVQEAFELCIHSVRLRPHMLYHGSYSSRRDEDFEFSYPMQSSTDGRWTATTSEFRSEQLPDHEFSSFQVKDFSWPEVDTEAESLLDKTVTNWLCLIDSAHEPAVLLKLCPTSHRLPSQFSFSADAAYLIIIHRDEQLRAAYGAGCVISLLHHNAQALSLPGEIQNLTDPVLYFRTSAGEHFIVHNSESTFVVDCFSGQSYCISLPVSIIEPDCLFCQRDTDLSLSVFIFNHAFHIYEHRAGKAMSLLRIVQRLDDVRGSVCNIDLRQLPHSILYTVDDRDTSEYMWLEQTLAANTPQSSRIIASSLKLNCLVSGNRLSLKDIQKTLAAPMVFLTAVETWSTTEIVTVTLLVWCRKRSGWSSNVIGNFSATNDRETGRLATAMFGVSSCGAAFAWINVKSLEICVAEVPSSIVSEDSAADCRSIPYPAHLGVPIHASFATVDESLFVLFKGPNEELCRQCPEYRVVAPDPSNTKGESSHLRRRGGSRPRLLANYKKNSNDWGLRWFAIVEDRQFDCMSADGSILILNNGKHASVLDFILED